MPLIDNNDEQNRDDILRQLRQDEDERINGPIESFTRLPRCLKNNPPRPLSSLLPTTATEIADAEREYIRASQEAAREARKRRGK